MKNRYLFCQYTDGRKDTCFFDSNFSAAVPFDQMMGHNDLRSRKIRVFNMTDHLRSCFHSKLSGIDINGGQLRGSQSGEQRVIKGQNG